MMLIDEAEARPKRNTDFKKKTDPSRNYDFDRFDGLQTLLFHEGVEIRMEDYESLDRRELLTDPIIDFYMQQIYLSMNEELRQRVHFYNTSFYVQYGVDSKFSAWKEEKLTAAEKRYNRVQDLPCNIGVNIFEKDFIVFPCHDNDHWFLTIVCFPRLNGAVTVDGGRAIQDEDDRKHTKNPGEPLKSSVILTFDSVLSNSACRAKASRYIQSFIKSEYEAKYQNEFFYDPKQLISHSVPVSHANKNVDS